MDKEFLGLTVKLWTIIAAVVVVVIILAIVLIVALGKKKKPRAKHVKVDEEFITNLLTLLGEKENIVEVTVDNGRLKFKVNDLDKVDLKGIQAVATSGVFVTGSIIKTLFKLDSQIIKKELEKRL